jgi:acetyltransferase-like isoleucine patch superfamily enzyme
MGHDVFIGDEVYIDNEYPEMIEIQDRAAVSMRAVIIAHSMGPGKVVIEREAFIGPQVVVLCSGGKTLRIGEGAVISAGCMITRSIPPRVVIAPAPTQLVGHASISMPASRTVEEFWSGLKPAKRSAGRGSTAAPRAGAPADSDKSA